MRVRQIVKIDESKCDGCGLCVTACAEGAIRVIAGKARVVSESYCDGLGACLGHCPQDAITVETREAPEFDAAAAGAHVRRLNPATEAGPHHECPGAAARVVRRMAGSPAHSAQPGTPSELLNWPVQLHLVSPQAEFLHDADVLLAADCVAFACADFHARFLRGRPVVIGCPKLDETEAYAGKLAAILKESLPRSLTVLHMEVPCCFGLTRLAQAAHALAHSKVPLHDVTISIQGEVLREVQLAPSGQEEETAHVL